MKGYPKFKIGDDVSFSLSDSEEKYIGKVYIVDAYGTFEDNSDVSYDVLVTSTPVKTLYKHVPERLVSKVL